MMPAVFEYSPGTGFFHRLDPRCKFFLACIVGCALVHAGWTTSLSGIFLFFLLLARAGIGPLVIIKQLKYFLLLLAMVIAARAISVSGTPVFTLFDIQVTVQGLFQGTLVALRFFLVMLLGLLLCATTRPAAIKAAIQWFLGPLPFIPEKRVGVMISLALRFLPMILAQAKASNQAMAARCGNHRKNPVKKISILTMALLGKTFRSADAMALAMDARGFTEDRTDPLFAPSGKEPAAIVAGISCALALFWL